jgi:hypothetical protein
MKFAQLNLNPLHNVITVDYVVDIGGLIGRVVEDSASFIFTHTQFDSASHLVQIVNDELWFRGGAIFRFEERTPNSLHLICVQTGNLRLPRDLAILLGDVQAEREVGPYRDYPMTEDEEMPFLGRIDIMKYVPHTLLVICSAVRPSIVGGGYVRLLKVVNLPNNPLSIGKYVTAESEHQDFKTLGENDISHMEFQIRTSDGERPRFVNAVDDQIMLQLHFQRKPRARKIL